jgi:ribosomal protein S18 acetylase RimI-like enzyme
VSVALEPAATLTSPYGKILIVIEIRRARLDDDAALAHIDVTTWTAATSPAPAPPAGTPFFDEDTRPADVLVAETGGDLVGYARVGPGFGIPAHRHVLVLAGLAVDPDYQGCGIGRQLVEAAVEEAERRGMRKLSLRVLGPNIGARRLYVRCGFAVEGVLQDEFLLDGDFVDDILMARALA